MPSLAGVTAVDPSSFPAALATINSVLHFHRDARISVTGNAASLTGAQRRILAGHDRVRILEGAAARDRSPTLSDVLSTIRACHASHAACDVTVWIDPGCVLGAPLDDIVDCCRQTGRALVDAPDNPRILVAPSAACLGDRINDDAIRPELALVDPRVWAARESHWESIIDFRDGTFVNLSTSSQRQRVFDSGARYPFWSRTHVDRLMDDHPLQTLPYVWFLAMLWFGRCGDWSADPHEYLPEGTRHLLKDLVHYLPQIVQIVPPTRYQWNALSDAMITRMLEGVPRMMPLGRGMTDTLALVDAHPWIRRYVEVGSYEGGSILTLALRFLVRDIDFYAVESFMGNLDGTVDGHPLPSRARFLDYLARYPGLRVRLVPGDSAHAAALFDDNSLDCVFIDACHATPMVLRDIDAWMPKLKRPAIIGGDDYGFDSVFAAVHARFSQVNVTPYGTIWWVLLT
jgi:methyltransferase family protein